MAKKHTKPCLHISRSMYDPVVKIIKFVSDYDIRVLNVAGSRESKEPGIYEWVKDILSYAFFWSDDHPNMLGGPGEG